MFDKRVEIVFDPALGISAFADVKTADFQEISSPNGFGVIGSISAWLKFRDETRQDRYNAVDDRLGIATDPCEIKSLRNLRDTMCWDYKPECDNQGAVPICLE